MLALAVELAGGAAPLGHRVTGQAEGPASQPARLVVVLIVDQMRADYVDRFRADWTRGLKRLLDQGAWFSRAAYPYLNTVTCAGHATVSTGAFPRSHGIIQNGWYDRETGRQVTCTEDPNVQPIGYGVRPMGGDSSRWLLLPTFADEMRTQRGARVVTLSLKARSAIMLAGRAGDAVTWLSTSLDGWQTSSAFSPAPVAAVQRFVSAVPIAADYGKTWVPLLPASRYLDPDAGESEEPPRGWTASFPHVLKGAGNSPDDVFRAQWEQSPFADAYLGRFAAALVESLQLGRHESPDVLGIGFSSPDILGHSFGPRSREVQDMYAHLDDTIGTLLDRLDSLVGRNQYVVALTSDHGVATIPEQLRRSGQKGGRVSAATLRDTLERASQAAGGPGRYIARVGAANEVYFEPGMYDRLGARPAAMNVVIKQLEAQPGIARVFRREQVRDAAASHDLLLRAAALSYVPQRSGDLLLAMEPGWTFAGIGTTHGTANLYDQQVPIILMGPNVKAGEYREAATPADVAPTLAALSGIAMPRAEGHVLRSALTTAPRIQSHGQASPTP
jgi:predicted AlkP superfamily pyrophosphatase or phosphodiesterase